jgi:type I restriction enzyme, S subunit
MNNWCERSLDELGYVSRGRSRHRPRDAEHLYGGNYPFVQTGDIKHSNLYVTNYSQTYSEAGLEQSRLWKAGTLCITIAANIADTAILSFDACFPDSVIGFIADEDKADARFVKYLFDALLQKRFKQFTQGAAQDNLSQEKLLSLKFPVPSDVKIQNRIANILSSYDDLIENNRRRIDLLEQSARMLYKEWFVSLRFPGHEHVKVKDGVPQGWKKTTLGAIAPLSYGKGLKADERIPGDYPVYGSSGIVGTHEKALVTGPGIIVGRKGNASSAFWSMSDFYPIDTTYYIDSSAANYFLYYLLLNTQFVSSDVAVPGLNRDYAHSLKINLPPKQVSPHLNVVRQPIVEPVGAWQRMVFRVA